MDREWIFGRQSVYEALRAGRRSASRLWLASKDAAPVKPGKDRKIKTPPAAPPAEIEEESRGRLKDILAFCKQKKIPVEQVPRHQLDGISSGHQGVALQVSPYPYVDFYDVLETARSAVKPFLLILDTLQDPQNLGTLLRTAEAVGVNGVLLPLRRTVTVTPAVVNASSGACEHLQIAQCNLAQAMNEIRQEGIWTVGLDAAPDALPPNEVDLNRSIAIVVGSEGQGMRSLVRSSCDLILGLPMRGSISSLNAATAGSVALYFAWQSRSFH